MRSKTVTYKLNKAIFKYIPNSHKSKKGPVRITGNRLVVGIIINGLLELKKCSKPNRKYVKPKNLTVGYLFANLLYRCEF